MMVLARPGLAVMTMILSASVTASSTLWVMNTTVFLSTSQMRKQLLLQDGAVLLVERRERLVHQQDLGIVGEGARDRDALAHAAGELVGVVVREAGEAGAVEIAPDRFLDLALGRLAHLQAIGRVLPDRHPREDRVALEHHGIFRPAAAPDR